MSTWYSRPTSADQALIACEETGKTIAVAYDKADGPLLAAAPDMLKALESTLVYLTNVNTNDPATLGRQIMAVMEKAGYEKQTLDDAAVAIVRGPCSLPNLMGDEDDK